MYEFAEINGSVEKGQVLIYPTPHRMSGIATRDAHKSSSKNHSFVTVGNKEEPSYEILDIFLSKNRCGHQTIVNNSLPYFCGSPPVRSDNPLVRDVKFIRIGVPSSPANLSQKTSCGASYGAKPSVRIEGFALKSEKPHCNLSALA